MATYVSGLMAFTKPEEVSDDEERKGVKRAASKILQPNMDVKKEFRFAHCKTRDCLDEDCPELGLETMGFETIDLSSNEKLQKLLGEIRVAGRVSREQGESIRSLIKSGSYKLANGKKLRLLYIASDGFIVRKAGPNGLNPNPEERMDGHNGHGGALNAHGDQDVYGTPLKQIMKGAAPWIFRHNTPDGENKRSPIFLINLWIPLQQITRPLVLMDRRTLNKKEHQLRFALPVDSFLERDENTYKNDIWTFLHDENQQWYFHSEMYADKAYVFDTLGEPHGAIILPGEKQAEQLYRRLESVIPLVRDKRFEQLDDQENNERLELPEDTPMALQKAIRSMEDLLKEAKSFNAETLDAGIESWLSHAADALDKLVRKSLEMRVVGIVTPF